MMDRDARFRAFSYKCARTASSGPMKTGDIIQRTGMRQIGEQPGAEDRSVFLIAAKWSPNAASPAKRQIEREPVSIT